MVFILLRYYRLLGTKIFHSFGAKAILVTNLNNNVVKEGDLWPKIWHVY